MVQGHPHVLDSLRFVGPPVPAHIFVGEAIILEVTWSKSFIPLLHNPRLVAYPEVTLANTLS